MWCNNSLYSCVSTPCTVVCVLLVQLRVHSLYSCVCTPCTAVCSLLVQLCLHSLCSLPVQRLTVGVDLYLSLIPAYRRIEEIELRMNQAYQKTLKAKEERIGELEKRLEEQELTNGKLREEVVAMKKLNKVQRVSSSPMSSPKVPRDHRFSMQYVAPTVHAYYMCTCVCTYMYTYILLVTACTYVRTYIYVHNNNNNNNNNDVRTYI